MKSKSFLSFFAILITASALFFQTGMSRRDQYDEEAREQERAEKAQQPKEGHVNPIKRLLGGVKQATFDSTRDLVSDTTQGTRNNAPVVGTVEGVRDGSEKVLDNTVKGVSKVARGSSMSPVNSWLLIFKGPTH